MSVTKSIVLAAMIAASGVAASAGGLYAPAQDNQIAPPPPPPARMGSLNGVLPVVAVVGLLLLLGSQDSTSATP